MPALRLSRRSFLKMIGISGAAWLLAACQQALARAGTTQALPTAQPSATRAPELKPPSPTPGATATLQPDPTPTATQPPAEEPTLAPTPVGLGVYTPSQAERLDAAARSYIALDQPGAIIMARSLNYVAHDGHPASVCGPLSAAILRSAGLISPYTNLHDFWLLNPRPGEGRDILERTFPKDQYTWFQSDLSIARFDFQAYPLQVGDFIYLYAGPAGSFEHMLVVSRLDELGRPYAVTNFLTPNGYEIDERMLFDPAQPGSGLFGMWTDRRNYKTGLTGFGGFELWRRSTPLVDPGPAELALAHQIDAVIDQTGGVWRIVLKELDGKLVYARHERMGLHPASVIKVPVALLFFKSLELRGLPFNAATLADGIDKRTYAQLLHAMLVLSEEDATTSVLHSIEQSRLDIAKTLAGWGAPHTDVYARHSTAWEIAALFEGFYAGRLVQPAARQYMLDLMSEFTPADNLRLGAMRLPADYPIFNKRGTIVDPQLVVADAAVFRAPVAGGDRTYVAGLFAYQDPTPGVVPVKYEQLEPAMSAIAGCFADYFRSL